MLGDFSKKDVKDMQNKFYDCIEQILFEYGKKEYDKARELMANLMMYLQNKRIEGYSYCIHRR